MKRNIKMLVAFLLAANMASVSAQRVMRPSSQVDVVTQMQKTKMPASAECLKQARYDGADKHGSLSMASCYSEMTKKQRALFFPYVYAQEMAMKAAMAEANVNSVSHTASDSSAKYKFVGFNTSLPGIDLFSVNPFSSETLAVSSSLTEYSYYYSGKYCSLKPIYNSTTRQYDQMDCVTFNTSDWEVDDSVRIKIAGQGEVPYISAYDSSTGMIYSVTMETTLGTDDQNSGDYYYLNVLNPETFKLTRIGDLCQWILRDATRQQSIQGMTIANGVIYAIDNYNRLITIDKTNANIEIVGKMKIGYGSSSMPDYNQIDGLQGMAYEPATNSILISHLDWVEGAVMYRAYIDDITDGVVRTEKLDATSTSYLYMYTNPATEEVNRLQQAADFSVVAGTNENVAISFVAPEYLVNGVQLTGNGKIKAICRVDGKEYSLGDASTVGVAPGEQVNTNITLPDGLHTISLELIASGFDSSLGIVGKSDAVSRVAYVGYDVPEAPATATLTITDNTATISWEAPTKGANEQWGATFDASDITYNIVRTYDNKMVASGISTTSYTDTGLGDEMHTYSYEVVAVSHGKASSKTVTNNVVNGTYVSLPYHNDFSDNECLDFFIIHNLNGDGEGRSWSWNYYYNYVVTMPAGNSFSNNYYLYTPKIKLDAKYVYLCNFRMKPSGKTESSRVRLSLSLATDTLESSSLKELYVYDGSPDDWQEVDAYFRPNETGLYNLVFRDYSFLNASDGGYACIDDFSIDQALSVDAPDSVTDVRLSKAEKGALKATLSFNAPIQTICGENLKTINNIKIFNGDNIISTIENPQPGTQISVEVDALNGKNTFTVVAYNENGKGWPVSTSAFIGPDIPCPVTGLRMTWGQDENDVEITWQKPSVTGANGGYVDPEGITYNVFKYNDDMLSWELLQSGIKTTNFTSIENIGTGQGYFTYAVTAQNDQGESDASSEDIFLGKGYRLPFSEPFAGTSLTTGPWISDSESNGIYWNFDNDLYDYAVRPVADDGLKLMLMSIDGNGGASRLTTPIIDLTGYEHPAMAVYLYHERSCSPNSFFRIDVSNNGWDFEPLTDNMTVNDDAGWVKHVFSLDKVKDQRVILSLYGSLDNSASRIFADSISVVDLVGTDLAINAISYDKAETVNGKNTTVKVTVANHGANSVSDYILEFYANNKYIGEAMPEEPLACGDEREFEFSVPVTAGNDTIKCYAQVIADDDINELNNKSIELTVTPLIATLPEPTDFEGFVKDDGVNLTWNAPANHEGLRFIEDFENLPAFSLNDFSGWTTVDVDHQITTSMLRMYGNYWPNAHLAQAWMIWNAAKANETSEYWLAKDGNQCLISWGSNGILDNGFISQDGMVNDDWLISPKIKGGSSLSFDAYATAASVYGNSTIEILTSSTDTNIDSFSLLEKISIGTTDESWQHFSFTLPENAKYVAIRNTFTQFAIMLDNLEYSIDKTPVFTGYNVYRDGVAQNSSLVGATSYTSKHKTGKFGVSAVYDLGESALAGIFDAELGLGIKDVKNGLSVSSGDGCIIVVGASCISVYNASGIQVANIQNADKEETISVVPGVYVVKTDKGTYKMYVK